MNASEFCIIRTTTDTKENAEHITQTLLEKRLVACVQSTMITSSYRWQGQILLTDEIQLDMKTKTSLFPLIKKEIEALHTYEVAEIIMLPIIELNDVYLEWIRKETL